MGVRQREQKLDRSALLSIYNLYRMTLRLLARDAGSLRGLLTHRSAQPRCVDHGRVANRTPVRARFARLPIHGSRRTAPCSRASDHPSWSPGAGALEDPPTHPCLARNQKSISSDTNPKLSFGTPDAHAAVRARSEERTPVSWSEHNRRGLRSLGSRERLRAPPTSEPDAIGRQEV